MEIRRVQEPDFSGVRAVAQASLLASYDDIIDETAIDALVDRLYARETLLDERDSDTSMTFVAEVDGEVVGFVQAEVVERDAEGTVRWLHVHPEHRGDGIGSQLFRTVRETLDEHDIERLTAEVLAEYDAGTTFYEERGFEARSERPVEIGDQEFVEREYVERTATERGMAPIETPEGTMYVDREDDERGSVAPFYPVYRDEAGERKWGWYCAACDDADTAMDTMGRIVCNGCENRRKPSRWDAAYM